MESLRAEHTQLIEREDDLLAQMDTCQQMIASIWRFIREGEDSLHPITLREMLIAVHIIEKRLQDELLEIRFEDILLGKRLRKKLETDEPKRDE